MAKVFKQGKSQEEINQNDMQVSATVSQTIKKIEGEGDSAVREISRKFDNWSPENFRLSNQQIIEIVNSVPEQTIEDIKFAQNNVKRFAEEQRKSMLDIEVETLPGVILGHKNIPVGSVGCYI
ncbi:MAG: histidinol dehydrogenase, partial [Priestia megaterium]